MLAQVKEREARLGLPTTPLGLVLPLSSLTCCSDASLPRTGAGKTSELAKGMKEVGTSTVGANGGSSAVETVVPQTSAPSSRSAEAEHLANVSLSVILRVISISTRLLLHFIRYVRRLACHGDCGTHAIQVLT